MRRPILTLCPAAILLAIHRLLFETTYVFRIAVILALAALGILIGVELVLNSANVNLILLTLTEPIILPLIVKNVDVNAQQNAVTNAAISPK